MTRKQEIEKELIALRTEKYRVKNNIKKFVEIGDKISKLEKEYKSID